jgi:uncharacterized integral membrane protein
MREMVYMQATFIISLIFSILVAIFALLNGDVVSINLVFEKFQMSQALVILIAAALGAVAVYFMSFVRRVKSALKIKELEKKLKVSETEILSLKEKINASELAAKEKITASELAAAKAAHPTTPVQANEPSKTVAETVPEPDAAPDAHQRDVNR